MANYGFKPKQRKRKLFVLEGIGPIISPEYQKLMDKYKESQQRIAARARKVEYGN